jgi:mRNA interferase RelE/StbE
VTDRRYALIIAPTAKRQLAEQLPESVAFAVYAFVIGPLLDTPHRICRRLRRPAHTAEIDGIAGDARRGGNARLSARV